MHKNENGQDGTKEGNIETKINSSEEKERENE
jgi:hypothetical protein